MLLQLYVSGACPPVLSVTLSGNYYVYFCFLGSELSEKTVRTRISEAFEKVRGVSLAREELQMFRYIINGKKSKVLSGGLETVKSQSLLHDQVQISRQNVEIFYRKLHVFVMSVIENDSVMWSMNTVFGKRIKSCRMHGSFRQIIQMH